MCNRCVEAMQGLSNQATQAKTAEAQANTTEAQAKAANESAPHPVLGLLGAIGLLGALRSSVPEQSIRVDNKHKVTIAPFESLDAALVTSEKVRKLVFPEALGEAQQELNYEAALLRSAALIPTLPEDMKFEGLAALLSLVLMGFNPNEVDDIKKSLREGYEEMAASKIKEANVKLLAETGFVNV